MLFCQFASMPVESTECVFQINPCVGLIRSACHFPVTVSESLRIFRHIEVNMSEASGPYGITHFLNACMRVCELNQAISRSARYQAICQRVSQSAASQPECPVLLLRAMCSLQPVTAHQPPY